MGACSAFALQNHYFFYFFYLNKILSLYGAGTLPETQFYFLLIK